MLRDLSICTERLVRLLKKLIQSSDVNTGIYVKACAGTSARQKPMTDTDIYELINRRRRQILVHSVIYYQMNDNLIADSTWSKWAVELDRLQKQYPEIASRVPYAEAFKDFDPSSGFNLPLDDPWAVNTARRLIEYRNRHK